LRRFIALIGLATACVVGVTACSSSTQGNDEAPFRIVVLGDSLSVDPPHDCDGCVTFLTQYAKTVTETLGRPVSITNDAVQNTGIEDTQRSLRGSVLDHLGSADLVLVWIGTNDGPPWPDASPCGPVPTEQVDELLVGIEGYTPGCVDATISEYGAEFATLFAAVAAASPDAQHLTMTTYDNWFENPFLDNATLAPERIDAIVEKVAATFDDWNAAQCAAAETADFACVDTYHLVNGADGRLPGGILFASDSTHLSQEGHDAVASLLATVDLERM